jgi:hypothetical protein
MVPIEDPSTLKSVEEQTKRIVRMEYVRAQIVNERHKCELIF